MENKNEPLRYFRVSFWVDSTNGVQGVVEMYFTSPQYPMDVDLLKWGEIGLSKYAGMEIPRKDITVSSISELLENDFDRATSQNELSYRIIEL